MSETHGEAMGEICDASRDALALWTPWPGTA
jgi:hypothetical protein